MQATDLNKFASNVLGSVIQDNAVAQAKFIIANSEKHEGMVKSWRTAAENYRASYGMLQSMNGRYLEIAAEVDALEGVDF